MDDGNSTRHSFPNCRYDDCDHTAESLQCILPEPAGEETGKQVRAMYEWIATYSLTQLPLHLQPP